MGEDPLSRATRPKGLRKETPVSDEPKEERQAEDAAETPERLLDETYLSGAVGMGAAGPRLSASALDSHDDEGILVGEDHSWKSHAIEEGDPGDVDAAGGGRRGFWRRLFGR
jgi:hypothetical protein